MHSGVKYKKPHRKEASRSRHASANETEYAVQELAKQRPDGINLNPPNYELTSVTPSPFIRHRSSTRDNSGHGDPDNYSPPNPSALPLHADNSRSTHVEGREIPTATVRPVLSLLESLAQGFGSIGIRDFKNCIIYLRDHPEILKANPEGLKAKAGRLFKNGEDESAACYLQRFIILTHCQQHGLSDVPRAAMYIKAIAESGETYADVQRKIAALSATLRGGTNTTSYLQTDARAQGGAKQIPIRSRSDAEYGDGSMGHSVSNQQTQPAEINMSRSLPGTTIQTAQSQPRGSRRLSMVDYHQQTSNDRLRMIDEQPLSNVYAATPNPNFVPGRGNPYRPADDMTAPAQMTLPNTNIQPGPGIPPRPRVVQFPPRAPNISLRSNPSVSMYPTSHNLYEREYHDSSQGGHRGATDYRSTTHPNSGPRPSSPTLTGTLQPGYPRSNPAVEFGCDGGDPSIRGDRSQLEMQRSNTVDFDGSYEVRGRQEAYDFFSVGRVFKLWWCRPAGSDLTGQLNLEAGMIKVPGRPDVFGEEVWMLVVVRRAGYSLCCPISTYQNQGVLRSGLPKKEIRAHAAIFSVEQGLVQDSEEQRLLGKDPIPICTDAEVSPLRPMSRVHFGKFHTVEWNVPVKSIGRVTEDHKERVRTYFISELIGTSRQSRRPPAPPPPPPPRMPPPDAHQRTSEGHGSKHSKQRRK